MEINTYFTQQTDVKKILKQTHKPPPPKPPRPCYLTDLTLHPQLQDRNIEVELVITNHEFNNLHYETSIQVILSIFLFFKHEFQNGRIN